MNNQIALVLALVAASAANAEVAEIVVTGSRVSGDDYSAMPAITITRQADFLVQSIHLTNDTRMESARVAETYQTIRDLLTSASKHTEFALAYGDEFLIPITADDYKIPLSPQGTRPDTSYVDIYIKIALTPKANISEIAARLDSFIKAAKVSGRTEIRSQGDVALSVVNPERFRYEIIEKIAQDAKRLRTAVAESCKINVEGLEGRVMWQRSDISELTLYIPHRIELSDCG